MATEWTDGQRAFVRNRSGHLELATVLRARRTRVIIDRGNGEEIASPATGKLLGARYDEWLVPSTPELEKKFEQQTRSDTVQRLLATMDLHARETVWTDGRLNWLGWVEWQMARMTGNSPYMPGISWHSDGGG